MEAARLFDLEGSVAVVTGGSRGLGRVMAGALAEAGADVVVASRKLDACERAAAEIHAATGRTVVPYACHVGHWDQVERLAGFVADRFPGGPDILVNNAGMSPLYDRLSGVTEALYDKVMDVNLKGPFRLSVLLAEQMAAAKGGSILNISSAAARHPRPNAAIYGMAKAGLNTMTTALAYAYGPQVRVNSVLCGPFLTDISRSWDPEESSATFSRTLALQRPAQASEIVGTMLYLVSRASSYTTGAALSVDGGYAPPSRDAG
ncbi:short-chain dehydrogenase [Pseudonocardia sp. CNS-139]|nr:short-chain dehydrogenase [Pseudonocardia sp. CNS-139]